MSKIGFGYGSEWHLLHHLGRHRNSLDRAVLEATDTGGVEWLDFCPSGDHSLADGKWEGIDFLFSRDATGLLDYSYLRGSWARFWPQGGKQQSWDAVGILRTGSQCEWLLVEAKAHTAEMRTEKGCMASPGSRTQIEAALANVGTAVGVADTSTWTGGYYQYANRLAALWFLLTHGVPARLLYVYFHGDPKFNDAPRTADGWLPSIDEQNRALGLDQATNPGMIEQRVHKIFLPVRGK